jgi:hypothetical protein
MTTLNGLRTHRVPFRKSQLSLRRRWVEPHRIRPSALAHRRSAPAPPARFLRGGGFRITSARGGGRGPSARPPTKRLGLRNGCQARAGFVLLTSETLLWVMKVGHCHKKEIRQSKRISGQYFGGPLIGALPTWPYSSGWGYYPDRNATSRSKRATAECGVSGTRAPNRE